MHRCAEGKDERRVNRGASIFVRVMSRSLIVQSNDPDRIDFCSRLYTRGGLVGCKSIWEVE